MVQGHRGGVPDVQRVDPGDGSGSAPAGPPSPAPRDSAPAPRHRAAAPPGWSGATGTSSRSTASADGVSASTVNPTACSSTRPSGHRSATTSGQPEDLAHRDPHTAAVQAGRRIGARAPARRRRGRGPSGRRPPCSRGRCSPRAPPRCARGRAQRGDRTGRDRGHPAPARRGGRGTRRPRRAPDGSTTSSGTSSRPSTPSSSAVTAASCSGHDRHRHGRIRRSRQPPDHRHAFGHEQAVALLAGPAQIGIAKVAEPVEKRIGRIRDDDSAHGPSSQGRHGHRKSLPTLPDRAAICGMRRRSHGAG